MNPRDIPEVISELIIEMHEVRSQIQAINGRLDRLDESVRALPEQIGTATMRALEPFLLKILDHNDQLKGHELRLGRLENPAAE